jgi:exodeoxyribonuclease VII small subunit
MSLKEMSYSEAKSELEEIIISLENADVDVDVLSAHVKKATQLIIHCKSKLLKAEGDVKKILEDFEKSQNKGHNKGDKDGSAADEGLSLFS